MQTVHLKQRHQVNLLENEVFAMEMAHHVKHQAPVGEARSIIDAAGRKGPARAGATHLQERLQGIESSLVAGRLDGNSLGGYVQLICAFGLSLKLFGIDGKNYVGLLSGGFYKAQRAGAKVIREGPGTL